MNPNQLESEIPDEELAMLRDMIHLSDDALWTAAREQMPIEIQERMLVLMTKNNFGTITDEEYAELASQVEEGNKLILRKATAMGYLVDRGYKVTRNDLKPINNNE